MPIGCTLFAMSAVVKNTEEPSFKVFFNGFPLLSKTIEPITNPSVEFKFTCDPVDIGATTPLIKVPANNLTHAIQACPFQ